ncbi:MAG: nuclear transport factor 2 family protein [bacterium]
MADNKKKEICRLLKGIETGDPHSVSVVNEQKYIQHNPQTHEGSEGLAALFKRLSKTSPRVNIVRIFEDGDFVFAHTEYDFASRNIGFEIFRFENGQAVEHWDNIQERVGPNAYGHTMVGGYTDVNDLGETERNRSVVLDFVESMLIPGEIGCAGKFFDQESFVEHSQNPYKSLAGSADSVAAIGGNELISAKYTQCHRVLAEGNFVLSVCEGYVDEVHSSFFDLYRLKSGLIVEHWDTAEAIPPVSEWKNDNGKF